MVFRQTRLTEKHMWHEEERESSLISLEREAPKLLGVRTTALCKSSQARGKGEGKREAWLCRSLVTQLMTALWGMYTGSREGS